MKVIATHFGDHDISWIPDYAGDDYLIYDRSDCGLPNRIPRDNVGDADYDRLSYVVDNYDNLPDVFVLTKSNLFKFITPEEWDAVKNNTDFTPLLTKDHKTYSDAYGVVCYYDGDMYCERNDSWYLNEVHAKHFNSYAEFARAFVLPNPPYLKFAPGGNYIVTRERIHRWSQEFYDELRSILPYCQRPGEAHMIERTYYGLWK